MWLECRPSTADNPVNLRCVRLENAGRGGRSKPMEWKDLERFWSLTNRPLLRLHTKRSFRTIMDQDGFWKEATLRIRRRDRYYDQPLLQNCLKGCSSIGAGAAAAMGVAASMGLQQQWGSGSSSRAEWGHQQGQQGSIAKAAAAAT